MPRWALGNEEEKQNYARESKVNEGNREFE